ncbi:hypothetical protein D1872_289820 [compost metagenome]
MYLDAEFAGQLLLQRLQVTRRAGDQAQVDAFFSEGGGDRFADPFTRAGNNGGFVF